MRDRIKQMLDELSHNYNAGQYISSSDKSPEKREGDRGNATALAKHGGLSFEKTKQFTYPAPRDPQSWQRPSFEANWQGPSGKPPVDPVDEAMKVLHGVQCEGSVCELNQTVYSDMDRPRHSDMPFNKKKRQKFSMPEEEFDPSGKPRKKRRGFFVLFRRK